MNGHTPDDHHATPDQQRWAERKRRGRVVVICSILVLTIDTWLLCWLIPWVDNQGWAITRFGSVGYVIYFTMIFFTFIVFLALVAYFFSRSSYPSDKWL